MLELTIITKALTLDIFSEINMKDNSTDTKEWHTLGAMGFLDWQNVYYIGLRGQSNCCEIIL